MIGTKTDPNTVLFTIPRKPGDPTQWTSMWGNEYVRLFYKMGYTTVVLREGESTYRDLNDALITYRPRTYIHVGHGCASNLIGQNKCMLTSGNNVESGDNTCKEQCHLEPNVALLDDTIVYTIACYSTKDLGRIAVYHGGCETYCGQDELLLFPVDNIGSDKIFRDVHLAFLKVLGEFKSSVSDAFIAQQEFEDKMIRRYKSSEYCSLPLLWNQHHREIIGNMRAKIWR